MDEPLAFTLDVVCSKPILHDDYRKLTRITKNMNVAELTQETSRTDSPRRVSLHFRVPRLLRSRVAVEFVELIIAVSDSVPGYSHSQTVTLREASPLFLQGMADTRRDIERVVENMQLLEADGLHWATRYMQDAVNRRRRDIHKYGLVDLEKKLREANPDGQ